MTSKTCKKCQRSLPVENFRASRGVAHARNVCGDCEKAHSRKYNSRHDVRRRAQEAVNERYRTDEAYREKKKARIRKYQTTPDGLRGNRHSKLHASYGLSIEEYERLLNEQNGLCKLCRMINDHGRALSVDHLHVPGFDTLSMVDKRKLVRGLLCERCNRALGLLRDDPTLMRICAEYVERFNG